MGLIASSYGVIIGSGGGFIIAPLLIIFFGLEHNVAVGTSLFAVAIASVSGSIGYIRLKRVDITSGIIFSLAAIPGVLLGVLGLNFTPAGPFEISFGIFLTILGLYILLRPRPTHDTTQQTKIQEHDSKAKSTGLSRFFIYRTRRVQTVDIGSFSYRYNETMAVASNGAFGLLAGFFGMGGGPIRTPALVYLFRFPVLVATATSVFTQAIYTSVGTFVHLMYGNVDLGFAFVIGLAVIVGSQIGVRISRYFRNLLILRLLSLALMGIGIQLIIDSSRIL